MPEPLRAVCAGAHRAEYIVADIGREADRGVALIDPFEHRAEIEAAALPPDQRISDPQRCPPQQALRGRYKAARGHRGDLRIGIFGIDRKPVRAKRHDRAAAVDLDRGPRARMPRAARGRCVELFAQPQSAVERKRGVDAPVSESRAQVVVDAKLRGQGLPRTVDDQLRAAHLRAAHQRRAQLRARQLPRQQQRALQIAEPDMVPQSDRREPPRNRAADGGRHACNIDAFNKAVEHRDPRVRPIA